MNLTLPSTAPFKVKIDFIFILLFFLFIENTVRAQLAFVRYDSIPVAENAYTFKNAWAGGINSALFSEIDLNLDGTKDIFFFEKDGFIVKTFLKENGQYHYAPQYQEFIPKMTVFALFKDYNCDGKEDLFTFAPGGMAVYKNVSSPLAGLDFTQITPLLKADYNPGFYNLYVAATDIPAIEDMDNDGDVDILSFDNNGTVVRYFKNLSRDLFGHCDSLKFQLTDNCWGKFYEHPSNNSVVFPFSCKAAVANPDAEEIKHTGSTLLAINSDGDSDKFLMLGDVSFKNMVALTNGGDSLTASVTAQDISFPSGTTPVNLLFPAGFYMDVDNDSVKDLIVASNTPTATENFNSVWLYRNEGLNNAPLFTYQKNNFLQEEMIDLGSGCNPAFFDYNADGLMDIVAGNYGYYNSSTGMYDGSLALFENTGTPSTPAFTLATRDFSGLSAEKINALYPAFGDIDGDGDSDMLIGEYDGHLLHYENTAGSGNTASFVLKDVKYKNIDVGHFSAPQIADLNRDGLPDLLVGEQDGTLNYFQNNGTITAPEFSPVPTVDTLGGIDVEIPCCTGYNSPFLFEESAGSYALLIGSQRGTVYYYTGIDENLAGSFTLSDSLRTGEFRTSIALADINNDGKNELAIGAYSGGMNILKTDLAVSYREIITSGDGLQIFPNPNSGDFLITGDYLKESDDIIFTDVFGREICSKRIFNTEGGSVRVRMENISPGIYFVQINAGGRLTIKKILMAPSHGH